MNENKHVVSRFDLAELTDSRAAKIEAMAEALWDYRRRGTGWEPWEELPLLGKSYYCDMATAALGALQLWELDATLDSVHPDALISGMWNPSPAGKGYLAEISWPHKNPLDDWNVESGYGPTRMGAIRDAVAKAKGEPR